MSEENDRLTGLKTRRALFLELDRRIQGEIVHCHQERTDGTGYPRGLNGDQITLGAKIVAVAKYPRPFGIN